MWFLHLTTLSMIALAACATSGPVETNGISPTDAKYAMNGQMSRDGSNIQCRALKQTGTRFQLHECKSEKVWAQFDKAMSENASGAMDRFHRNGCGNPTCKAD
jgi:hypothetical protein